MAAFEPDPWLDEFLETDRFVFEWDRGNRTKNWRRHGVTTQECEEVFLNGPLPIGIQVDPLPAKEESRYAVIGETWEQKPLFIVFTVRQGKVRVVSARMATTEEREDYDLLR